MVGSQKNQTKIIFFVVFFTATIGALNAFYLFLSHYFPSVYIFCDTSPQNQCSFVHTLFIKNIPIPFFELLFFGAVAIFASLFLRGFVFQKIAPWISGKKIIVLMHCLSAAALGVAGYDTYRLISTQIICWLCLLNLLLAVLLWVFLIIVSLKIRREEQETKTCSFC